MNRREFSTSVLATGAALALPTLSQAQGAPVEGKHYVRLTQPVAEPCCGIACG